MNVRSIALVCAVFCASILFPLRTMAATLYIDPYTTDVLKGDTVTLAVRIDPDAEECINTVDAVISYSDTIQAIDVSRGRSILTMWVEEPVIDTNARTITFAGGIPNGYCGRIPGDPSLTNIVAELVFRAPSFSIGRPDDVSALVNFEPGTRVLLNDGLGTDAPLKVINGAINLLQSLGTTTRDGWRDRVANDSVPPQEFSIELARDPNIFGNKYFIVWNTTDKQSGLSGYEVYEEPREDLYNFRWGAADVPWVPAESPYVLKDQELRSTIRVKAIDKAGNIRVVTLVPDESLRSLPLVIVAGAVALGVVLMLVCAGLVWLVVHRRRKRKAIQSESI